MAVLELKKDGSVVDAIVNAVVEGYKDDLIIEELANAVENETLTKDQFQSAVDALKLYTARFTGSIQSIVNSMSQFEFNDKRTILKNRPMNLAQQVMQDVKGFDDASKEFYDEDEEGNAEKEADIKKPQPQAQPAQPKPVPAKPVPDKSKLELEPKKPENVQKSKPKA
jgi:hypothetical protein